jgi:hypothetical protein
MVFLPTSGKLVRSSCVYADLNCALSISALLLLALCNIPQEDLTNLPDVGRNTIPKLPEIRVMEKGVLKLLQNLKVHKAAGPDTCK